MAIGTTLFCPNNRHLVNLIYAQVLSGIFLAKPQLSANVCLSIDTYYETCAELQVVLDVGGGVGQLGAQPVGFEGA